MATAATASSPGVPEAADPAKLRHLDWAESDEWAYGGGLYYIACDYRLCR